MSCDNASAPLNLLKNTDRAVERCSIICEYNANYPSCTGTVRNKGDYLLLMMDVCLVDVTYNRNKYDLSEVRMYSPSLHAYDGAKADAEIIIIHTRKAITSEKQRHKLFVCIPVKQRSPSINAQGDWFSFMPLIPMYYPNKTEEAKSISLPGWSLNMVLPKGDYYNYQGTSPFDPCSDIVEYIVYSMDQAASINADQFNMLQASLPNKSNIKTREYKNDRLHKLYWHQSSGSYGTEGGGLGDVYLDCRDVNGDSPEDSNNNLPPDLPSSSASSSASSSSAPPSSKDTIGGEIKSEWDRIPAGTIPAIIGSVVGVIILIKIWDYMRDRDK